MNLCVSFTWQCVLLVLQEPSPVVSEHKKQKEIEEKEELKKKKNREVGGQIFSLYNFTWCLNMETCIIILWWTWSQAFKVTLWPIPTLPPQPIAMSATSSPFLDTSWGGGKSRSSWLQTSDPQTSAWMALRRPACIAVGFYLLSELKKRISLSCCF